MKNEINSVADLATLYGKQIDIYKKALEFYADRDNWTGTSPQACSAMIGPDDHEFYAPDKRFYAGERARIALTTAMEAIDVESKLDIAIRALRHYATNIFDPDGFSILIATDALKQIETANQAVSEEK